MFEERSAKVLIIAFLLIAAGGALLTYKVRALGFPLLPDSEAQVWTVEAAVSFEAGPAPIKVRMFIPGLTPGFAILDENFVSRGFGATTRYVAGGREVQWARRRARGPQTLYYRAVVYRDPTLAEDDTTPPFPPSPIFAEPFSTAASIIVEDVGSKSADPASFTQELLQQLNSPGADQNVDLLLGLDPDIVDVARTATTLLAAALIPARLLRGIYLEDQQRYAEVIPWLMVHDGTRWLYFDPDSGQQGLPNDFLVWWNGTESLTTLDGGRDLDVTFSVSSSLMDPVSLAQRRSEARAGPLGQLSLFALPIRTQAVYSVLLLVPLGALLVVILRNLVGVQTFGTFMPVLIALAFRETQLLWGILLFSVLVALGLGLRFYLERLRLLAVPRVGAVLIIVVLLMLAISVLSHRLGLDTGLSVALFPMVILAMTIERMSIVWEERGAEEAIQQGLGSLLVAAVCYAVMDLDTARHLVFVFPESLLIVLAFTLLVGRYTGYRLTELRRFRAFGQRGSQ
ncbi:MAG: inactive transglutaminase family protein [Gammaproteobacteria bacterium]|nr:inactive transglutaminase family protein [Gammaproteobacteria bacterium]